MADEINYKVNVDTSGVKQSEGAFASFQNKASKTFDGIGSKIKDVGNKFGELPGSVGVASSALMGLGRAMMVLVANPIGAVIAALVGIFAALKGALTKSEDGMDALARISSVFGAILNPIIQAVSKFAALLVNGLATGLEMVAGLFGSAASEGGKLADVQDQLEDQELALAQLRAKQNKELAQARELLSDSNAALGDRRKALDQVKKGETELATKELQFAKNRLAAAKEDQRLNGQTEESKKAISDAVVGVANAETELAAKRRLFNREQKKLDAEEEQAAKEKAARAKEYTDQRKSALKDIRSAEQQNIIDGIKDETERAKKQADINLENAKRDIKAGEYTAKEKARLLKAAQTKFNNDIAKIDDDAEKKKADKIKEDTQKANDDKLKAVDDAIAIKQLEATKTIENEKALQDALANLELDRLRNMIQAKKELGQSTTDLELQLANKELDIKRNATKQSVELSKSEKDAKLAIFDATSNALGSVMQLVGEQTAMGKSLAVAQAIIDTYTGATKAFAQGGILGYIGAAGVVAAGMANVRKIVSTEIPGQSASGGAPSMGPSVSIIGGSADPSAQLARQFSQQNQKPVKAYTVGTDMSSQQALDRRIQTNATFPG
jgi:chemotaxis protein histidine kinase CheA